MCQVEPNVGLICLRPRGKSVYWEDSNVYQQLRNGQFGTTGRGMYIMMLHKFIFLTLSFYSTWSPVIRIWSTATIYMSSSSQSSYPRFWVITSINGQRLILAAIWDDIQKDEKLACYRWLEGVESKNDQVRGENK